MPSSHWIVRYLKASIRIAACVVWLCVVGALGGVIALGFATHPIETLLGVALAVAGIAVLGALVFGVVLVICWGFDAE